MSKGVTETGAYSGIREMSRASVDGSHETYITVRARQEFTTPCIRKAAQESGQLELRF